MTDKTLKDRAIKIQGKEYVLVADRVKYFNETYPNGCIKTKVLPSEGKQWVVVAYVYPDIDKPGRVFTGHSQAVEGEGYINKTSALENCETSAIGRALAMMGIGVMESIASVDEMHKARVGQSVAPGAPVVQVLGQAPEVATPKQKKMIIELLHRVQPDLTEMSDTYMDDLRKAIFSATGKVITGDQMKHMSKRQASELIEQLMQVKPGINPKDIDVK